MWKKNDEMPEVSDTPSHHPAAESRRSSGGGQRALIGESVRVEGTIDGKEDLLIEGEVMGTVKLHDNAVTIGSSGRVKADVHGRRLVVEGKVQGDLFAGEQAVVRSSGEVRGNITSPRVTLEDGAKFKGSIDMEPDRRSSAGGTAGPAVKATERPAKPPAAAGGGGDSPVSASVSGEGGGKSADRGGDGGSDGDGKEKGRQG